MKLTDDLVEDASYMRFVEGKQLYRIERLNEEGPELL